MKTINLPANTETIKFTDLSKLIGIALIPDESELSKRCTTSVWYEGDTVSAAYSGGLTVRNPLTRRPWPPGGFTSIQLLVEAVVTPDDLRHYLAGCGIEVVVAQESAQVPSAPPAVDTTPPETQPATPAEQRQAAVAAPAPVSEAQTAAKPAPVVQVAETKEQRQDRRLQACIDAGLPMNMASYLSRLPDGVGDVADKEGITRQAFSTDIRAALKRRESARREGATAHRA
jgi:hypothetical protein